MKTTELKAALEKLGKAYTGKDKTKPADPIVKLLAFLEKRTEDTIDGIVTALTSTKNGQLGGRLSEPSVIAKEYIEQLNKPALAQEDFEKIFSGINTLQKAPAVQVARGYSFKSKIDTKGKALAAIREEFFRRARERDKARKDEHSLLM
jgi:hypothetical protein